MMRTSNHSKCRMSQQCNVWEVSDHTMAPFFHIRKSPYLHRKRLGLHVGTPAFFIESNLIVKIKKRLSAYLAPSTMWSITNARAEAPTNMTAAIVINVIILITFSFLCFFNFLITTPCGRPFFFPLARCYLNYNLLVFRRCKGTKTMLCAQTVG